MPVCHANTSVDPLLFRLFPVMSKRYYSTFRQYISIIMILGCSSCYVWPSRSRLHRHSRQSSLVKHRRGRYCVSFFEDIEDIYIHQILKCACFRYAPIVPLPGPVSLPPPSMVQSATHTIKSASKPLVIIGKGILKFLSLISRFVTKYLFRSCMVWKRTNYGPTIPDSIRSSMAGHSRRKGSYLWSSSKVISSTNIFIWIFVDRLLLPDL